MARESLYLVYYLYNNHYKIQYGDIETEYTVTYDKVISLFNQSFLYKNII